MNAFMGFDWSGLMGLFVALFTGLLGLFGVVL